MRLTTGRVYSVAGTLMLAASSFAQETEAPVPESGADTEAVDGHPMISIEDVQPILMPVSDYTGTFTERTTITGDWGGTRQEWLDNGFAFNASLTQTFRTVASGGVDSGDTAYNGLLDYGITLDTARLGLWPGGYFAFNAQTAFGSDLPLEDGAVSPSDYNAVFPTLERPTTELMEYYWIQGLAETMGVMIGRVDPIAWDRNRFAFDPRTQFMNGALDQQLLVGGLVSFSTYTVSAMVQLHEHVNILTGIYDPVIAPGEFDGPFEEIGYYARQSASAHRLGARDHRGHRDRQLDVRRQLRAVPLEADDR
jgi:hypothetical protein